MPEVFSDPQALVSLSDSPGSALWIPISSGFLNYHSWWSPDGNTLYFLSRRDGFACIWAQPLDPATKQPEGAIKDVRHLHGRLRVVESGAAQFGLCHAS